MTCDTEIETAEKQLPNAAKKKRKTPAFVKKKIFKGVVARISYSYQTLADLRDYDMDNS